MKNLSVALVGIVLSVLVLIRCGSDSSVGTDAEVVVSNPLSMGSTITASVTRKSQSLWAIINTFNLSFILKKIGFTNTVYATGTEFTSCTGATGDLAEACAAPAEVASVVNDIQAETTGFATAKSELANFITDTNAYRAGCYGPGWRDNATGSNTDRPTGDLGMVHTDTSPTNTMACSAGQMMALLAGYPSFANDVFKFKALVVSALQGAGTDPNSMAVGATLNAASVLPTITGVTITAATITRFTDAADGSKIFYTKITAVDGSGKDFDSYSYDKVPAMGDKGTGVLKAIFPNGASGNTGLSMVYTTSADGTLKYELRTAQNTTADGSSGEDFFAADGEINFANAAFVSNGNIIRASINTNTNAATMHYAWQAGRNDGASRVFSINIPAGSAGALSGVSYAGYGASIGSLAASPGGASTWATKFHCNWLNSLGTGPSVAKVQRQAITQSGGTFVNSGTAKINFAPTDACTTASTWTISNPSIGAATVYAGTRAAVAATDADYLTDYVSGEIPEITGITNPWDGSSLPTN